MGLGMYVLGGADGKTPTPVEDFHEWGRLFADNETRIVAQETVLGVMISTVFLGLDHNWSGKGPPIVFESMVFLPGEGEIQRRYATWDEALAGHMELSNQVRAWAAEAGEVTQATMADLLAKVRGKF